MWLQYYRYRTEERRERDIHGATFPSFSCTAIICSQTKSGLIAEHGLHSVLHSRFFPLHNNHQPCFGVTNISKLRQYDKNSRRHYSATNCPQWAYNLNTLTPRYGLPLNHVRQHLLTEVSFRFSRLMISLKKVWLHVIRLSDPFQL